MYRVAHVGQPERVAAGSTSDVKDRYRSLWYESGENAFRSLEFEIRGAFEEPVSLDSGFVMSVKPLV